MVAADGVADLGEVAHPRGGHDRRDARRLLGGDPRQHALVDRHPLVGQQVSQLLVERGDAVVVEGRGRRAVDGHVGGALAEGLAVAHHLAADVTQGVLGAAALELVDGDDVGAVEHVDLLELAAGAELGRHDVERDVGVVDDGGVALADAGSLEDDEVEAGRAHDVEDVVEVRRDLGAAARREAAEEDPVTVEGAHADAVAEQGAATAAAGGVDGEDGDAQLVLLVEAQAADQLVGETRLARAAGAGDAEDRDAAAAGGLVDAARGSPRRCRPPGRP